MGEPKPAIRWALVALAIALPVRAADPPSHGSLTATLTVDFCAAVVSQGPGAIDGIVASTPGLAVGELRAMPDLGKGVLHDAIVSGLRLNSNSRVRVASLGAPSKELLLYAIVREDARACYMIADGAGNLMASVSERLNREAAGWSVVSSGPAARTDWKRTLGDGKTVYLSLRAGAAATIAIVSRDKIR